MNSKFLVPGSLSVLALIAIFFVSVTINHDSNDLSTQSMPSNYEDICGTPVTDEMRLDIISKKSYSHDSIPYLKLHKGTFTHLEKSQYLTDIPIVQYWFDLENGKQVYFEMNVCDLEGSNITLGEIGPNYKKPQDIVMDGIKYKVLLAPGSPLIYKDTLKPVLDVSNCKRIADDYTIEERTRLIIRDDSYDPVWKNQLFPLMDYCTGIGNYEMKTVDGHVTWSFTLI